MNSVNDHSSMPQATTCDYLMILRGLSAIAVVFCHLPFELHNIFPWGESFIGNKLDWVFDPFGYIPVLIFFSLSGYLITLGFYSNRHDPVSIKGIKSYYRSRILRILPLYYFSILFCVLIYWSIAEKSPLRVAGLFVFVENYKPLNGIVFNHVYWTMPVEMLYFLMAPFIFIALKKAILYINALAAFGLLGAIFLVIAFLVFGGLPSENGFLYVDRREWSLMARFDFIYNLMAFVLGGVCVFVVRTSSYRVFYQKNRTLIKLITSIFFVWVVGYSSTTGLAQLNAGKLSYFIAFALIPCVALFVLGVAILNETQNKRPGVLGKLGINLGLLSYGVYLFHMPVFDVVRQVLLALHLSISHEITSLLVLCVTLLLSQFTYSFVEKPFLYRRDASVLPVRS